MGIVMFSSYSYYYIYYIKFVLPIEYKKVINYFLFFGIVI